jgi:hypothetical protein
MIRAFRRASLAVVLIGLSSLTTQAAICKTLKGEWVGFGEKDTRQEAETRLDQEISGWKQRYSLASLKPKARKVSCKVYIQMLNEYECKAEATVCR